MPPCKQRVRPRKVDHTVWAPQEWYIGTTAGDLEPVCPQGWDPADHHAVFRGSLPVGPPAAGDRLRAPCNVHRTLFFAKAMYVDINLVLKSEGGRSCGFVQVDL